MYMYIQNDMIPLMIGRYIQYINYAVVTIHGKSYYWATIYTRDEQDANQN